MATFYSDQVTKTDQTIPSKKNDKNTSGDLTRIFFSYTTPASGMPTVGDVIQLAQLPDNCRVMGIAYLSEAMSTAAGTAGFDLGITGTGQQFAAAVNVDSAVTTLTALANTIAGNFGSVISVPSGSSVYLIATVTGEQWAASKKFQGYIDVLLP